MAQLFRGILGREGSAGDIAHHAGLLRDGGPQHGIAALASVLANSGEVRGRGRVGLMAELAPGVASGEHPVQTVISLGTHCYTGKLLQLCGLKRFSTPFDWVFSTAPMIAHCLRDDFATFLDAAQHSSYADAPPPGHAEHLFYRQAYGIDTLFNHRDPGRDGNLDYYRRGAERFRRLCRDGTPFIGLMVSEFWKTGPEDFRLLADTLSELAPAASLVCVRVFGPEPHPARFGYEVAEQRGRHRLVTYNAAGQLLPLNFECDIDNVVLMGLLARMRTSLAA